MACSLSERPPPTNKSKAARLQNHLLFGHKSLDTTMRAAASRLIARATIPLLAHSRPRRAVASHAVWRRRAGEHGAHEELECLRKYVVTTPPFNLVDTIDAAVPLVQFDSSLYLWPTLVPRESYVAYHTLRIVCADDGAAHAETVLHKARRFGPLGQRRAEKLRPMCDFEFVVDFVDQFSADELDAVGC